jgi:hypothetical protein
LGHLDAEGRAGEEEEGEEEEEEEDPDAESRRSTGSPRIDASST